MSKKDKNAIVSGAGWIGSFSGLLVEELENLGVSFEDIHKLGKPTKEGKVLVLNCAQKIAEIVKGSQNEFLRSVSGGDVEISATTGQESIWGETDLFAYVDSDFKNWSADEKGQATPKISVCVREMIKDGKYAQLFGSLSSDPDRLCLTPAQIADFIRNHRDLLRTDGYATFFLFKSHGHFFVARVCLHSDGLGVSVRRLEHSDVWSAGSRPRLVAPQLA